MLGHFRCLFVQYFKGDFAGETNLFVAAVFVHVCFEAVASNDDIFGAEEADGVAGVTAG